MPLSSSSCVFRVYACKNKQSLRKNAKIPCAKEILPIFAPAKMGEIVSARESAFFALFLVGELAHSLTKRGILKGGCFRCDVCVISSTKHTQWSIPVIHYFSFQGVQALPTEIRISLGGSALFAS